MNIFFVMTAFYFMHCDGQVDMTYTLPFYGFFLVITVVTMVQGVIAIKSKDQKKNVRIGLLRIFIEMFKIVICILILNCYNAAFQQSEEVRKTLGKIRFSILVQEILSMALCIPIISLGRLIFYGFSIPKFSKVFDVCIAVLEQNPHKLKESDTRKSSILQSLL